MIRRLLLAASLAAALVVSGCGNKQELVTLGETEGIYVTVGNLKYQVQISRILNPADEEDGDYLRGVSEAEAPTAEEIWFGVFMRVENDTDAPHMAASEFEIEDTEGETFEPLPLTLDENVFAYEAVELAPGRKFPPLGRAADENSIRGGLLLFKITTDSLGDRPLELKIIDPSGEGEGVVDLDV